MTVSRLRILAGAVVLVTWSVAAWAQPAPRPATNLTRGCVERFDAAVDYFPEKAVVEDAANFKVEYRKSYKVVTLKEAYAGGPPEKYVLVQCGTPAPALTGELEGAQTVRVPIRSLFAFSPTHFPLLVDLRRIEVLTGVANVSVVDSPDVQAHLDRTKVVEFARTQQVIDVERVVAAKPDLYMAAGASTPALAVIRSGGVPVVANTEWLEVTGLGRAEWLKYMAVFLNEERQAQEIHAASRRRYRALSARALTVPEGKRPVVMTGRASRGTFVIAGGRSYVAAFIKDAGGRYIWPDNASVGSASVDLEAQMHRGAKADIWINGGGWANLPAMLENEPRYAEFASYRRGQVWVYERRQKPGGGNDYWSRSITRPDLVLADLVKIFHPALMPDHAFEWYMQVPTR